MPRCDRFIYGMFPFFDFESVTWVIVSLFILTKTKDKAWLKQSEGFLVSADKLIAEVKNLLKKSDAALEANASVLEEGEGQLVEIAPIPNGLSANVSALEAAVRGAIASAPELNRVDEEVEEEDDEDDFDEHEQNVAKRKS